MPGSLMHRSALVPNNFELQRPLLGSVIRRLARLLDSPVDQMFWSTVLPALEWRAESCVSDLRFDDGEERYRAGGRRGLAAHVAGADRRMIEVFDVAVSVGA